MKLPIPIIAFAAIAAGAFACASHDQDLAAGADSSGRSSAMAGEPRGAMASAVVDSGWLPLSIKPVSPGASPAGGQLITLRNGRAIRAAFYVDTFVTALPRSSGIPFLVFGMVPCSRGCGAAPGIVAVPADTASLDSIPAPSPYPGSVSAPGDSGQAAIVFRSRLFTGECLEGAARVLVWFAQSLDSTGTWEPLVLRLRVDADTLDWSALPAPWPPLQATLDRVRAGTCKEVPGREQMHH